MSKKEENSSKGQSYEPHDVVLAKVHGCPPWPGMIVDLEGVPDGDMKELPNTVTKEIVFYCVRFFPEGNYAWVRTEDMSKLQTREIEAYINEPVQRSGELLSAYRIALDPTKWEAQLEVDRTFGKPMKRKRDSEAASGVEDDGGGPDDEDDDAGPCKKGSPPSKQPRRDKDDDGDLDPSIFAYHEALKVGEWRRKIQKTFLSVNGPPKDDEMPGMNELFTTLETYDKYTPQNLAFSKIGKVMRHITKLSIDKVPRDEEFKFRQRAQAFVDRWQLLGHSTKSTSIPATPSIRTTSLSATPLSASTDRPALGQAPRLSSASSSSDHLTRLFCTTVPQALQKIGKALCIDAETTTEVKMGLDEARIADLQRPSQSRAIEQFSRLDAADLSSEALLAIVDLFNTDSAHAITYLAMESSDVLRRAWLRRELARLNLPSFVSSKIVQSSSSGLPSGSL